MFARRYFTILIPLNTIDENGGGTEIWSKAKNMSDLVFLRLLTALCGLWANLIYFLQIRPRPGDAFVFNGSLEHRGQANSGTLPRFFYYASFACRSDANADS